MPAAERRRETGTDGWLLRPPSWIPGRIRGRVAPPGRGLTRSGEAVKRKMAMTPEPKDKLDAPATVVANGPEDANLGWRQIDWRACEGSLRRLRQRSVPASQPGHLKRV